MSISKEVQHGVTAIPTATATVSPWVEQAGKTPMLLCMRGMEDEDLPEYSRDDLKEAF